MKILFNKFFYFVFFAFVNATIFLDSYKYPGFFKKHFFIDSKLLFVLFIIYLILFFLKNKKFFQNKVFKSFNLSFAFLSLVIMVVFSWLEFSHYENYVYNIFHINHAHFLLFFLEGVILAFLTFWQGFFKKINIFIIYLFIVFLLVGMFAYTFQSNLFIEMNKEDRLVENLQFFVVVLASLFSFFLSRFYKIQKKFFFFIFYLFVGLVLLFIAGDEISWGQRLFNYQTPESIIDYTDQQNEVSWHNTKGISQYLGQIYLAIGAYGSFSFIIYQFIKKFFYKSSAFFKHFFILFPASLFFFLKFIYDYLASFSGIDLPFKFNSWSEYVELAMYLGIFIQLFLIYYKELQQKEGNGKN
jgi:hypothetical protein